MRRSATITLTLLAGTGLGLAYCSMSDPDAEGVLATASACVDRLGDDAASECAEVFATALATHESTAPRFGSADECRAATGSDCVPLGSAGTAAGGSSPAVTAAAVFVPVMAGVLIGRALADGTRGATPVYSGLPPGCVPPLQPGTACAPSASGGTGATSASASRRFWYSGSSYAGSSEGEARSGFRRASTSADGEGMLSRGARSSAGAGRSGAAASRSGGFGFSASAHGGRGS